MTTNPDRGGQQGSAQHGSEQKGGGPGDQGAGKTTGQQGSPQGGAVRFGERNRLDQRVDALGGA